MSAVPPFSGCHVVDVICPRVTDHLSEDEAVVVARLPDQITTEAAALARELGAPVRVVDAPQGGATWWIGPAACNPSLAAQSPEPTTVPVHRLDRAARTLITDAPDVSGIVQAFGGLRSLSRLGGGTLTVAHATDGAEAVRRIAREVADTWPGLAARGIDWPRLCDEHVWKVLASAQPVAAMQRWLASLGDLHTWVRPVRTQVVLPYSACVVDGEVVVTWVWEGSLGYAHGLRPGWRLVGEEVRETWATTPAPPHAKPLLVARRLLSGTPGTTRTVEARSPSGAWARWDETFTLPTGAPAAWDRLDDGLGYLWIGAWVPDAGIEELVDEALEALADAPALLVDLRGNGGGRMAMAEAFRARFLDRDRPVGWIRTTEPGGRLGDPEPLNGVRADSGRWDKPVRFLTSPLTYSASEDALLGLQGQPNVTLVGERTGGGSGRLRRLPLLPGWRLTITSSLTYDTRGRCVEGQGLMPNVEVVPDRRRPTGVDEVLEVARRG